MTAKRPERVQIVEVAPRDGLQNETIVLPVADRLALIRSAAAAGLTRIEVASFVNPARVPTMAGAEELIAEAVSIPGLSLSALVLNERGFERAHASAVDEINFVVVASETFSQRNQGASIAQTLDAWRRIAPAAGGFHRCVTIGAAFGCPFEGEVPLQRVLAIAEEAAAAGLEEIALADTIGVAGPLAVETAFSTLRQRLPQIRLRAHFHNTRNTGYANADAALRCGVTALDASLGGVGGCPFAPEATGNIATEDLAYMLRRNGVQTGLDEPMLLEASRALSERLERRLPAQLPHVRPFPPFAGEGTDRERAA